VRPGARRFPSRALGLALLGLVLWRGGLGAWRAQRWDLAGWHEAATWSAEQRLAYTLRQGKRRDVYAPEVLRLRARILAESDAATPFVCRNTPPAAGRTVYDQLAVLIYPRPTAFWEVGEDPTAGRAPVLYLSGKDAPREPWMDGARVLESGEHLVLWKREAE
jgi:hypothetical protein